MFWNVWGKACIFLYLFQLFASLAEWKQTILLKRSWFFWFSNQTAFSESSEVFDACLFAMSFWNRDCLDTRAWVQSSATCWSHVGTSRCSTSVPLLSPKHPHFQQETCDALQDAPSNLNSRLHHVAQFRRRQWKCSYLMQGRVGRAGKGGGRSPVILSSYFYEMFVYNCLSKKEQVSPF